MDGPRVKIRMEAEKEITANVGGQLLTKRVPTKTIEPGGIVYYTLLVQNVGDSAATNIVVNDPIPDGAVYVPGSAYGEKSRITVSLDDSELFVIEPAEVLAESVSAIRWEISRLKAGGECQLGFEVAATSREATRLARLWSALYVWFVSAFGR